jgi:hypothetical protein
MTDTELSAARGKARGENTGIYFPTTIDSLRALGPPFLTEAFHATGALPRNNSVTKIVETTEFHGGGMGRKLLLSVQYERPGPDLDQGLFIKFPRDVGDPLRELFAPLMRSEVRFALLSRAPSFPLVVPKCYFGDYDPSLTSGLLITNRIPFGCNGIEPARDKCKDYELGDPLPYFRVLACAMGQLAGQHRAGRLGDIDELFPAAPPIVDVSSRIPFARSELPEKLAQLRALSEDVPQLFPGRLGSAEFLDQLDEEIPLVFDLQDQIRSYLQGTTDYVALCNTNMNIDNAWFWTDAGEKKVGLLDWGGVSRMNLAQAFYGMICSCETRFNNAHRRELMELVVREYRRAGGPQTSLDPLFYMARLATAFLGTAWTLTAPAIIAAVVADYRQTISRFDPRLRDSFLGRVQTQCLMVFMNEWKELQLGAALRDFEAGRRDY